MNILEPIVEILKYFIGTGLVTAAIIFVGKKAIEKICDGLVETYKFNLNTELEGFKAKQQKVLEEYKITYSKLHENRSNVIIELYKRLVRLEGKIELFVQWSGLIYKDISNGDPGPKIDELLEYGIENFKKSVEDLQEDMFQDFNNFVNENDIFFTQNITISLIELNKNLSTINILKEVVNDFLHDNKFKHNVKDVDKFNETLEKALIKIQSIKKELRNEFQGILGVK